MADIPMGAILSRRRALAAALAGWPTVATARGKDSELARLLAQWLRLNEHYASIAGRFAQVIAASPPPPGALVYRDRQGRERVINESQIEALRRELTAIAGKEQGDNYAEAKLVALRDWRRMRDRVFSATGDDIDAECVRIEEALEAVEKKMIAAPATTARGIAIKLALWRLHTSPSRPDRGSAFALAALADAERIADEEGE